MDGNGCKWMEMSINVWKWIELLEMEGMAGTGWKLLEMAWHGWK